MLLLSAEEVVITHACLTQLFLLRCANMYHIVVAVIPQISAVFATAHIHGHAAGILLVYLFKNELAARNSKQLLLKAAMQFMHLLWSPADTLRTTSSIQPFLPSTGVTLASRPDVDYDAEHVYCTRGKKLKLPTLMAIPCYSLLNRLCLVTLCHNIQQIFGFVTS